MFPPRWAGKETITWTRFRLPPDQEWPNWPCSETSHPAERYVGPLARIEGARWSKVRLGRMVEFPEEAVYMIQWETMDDLHNFLASPTCDQFLQHLPEHGHQRERDKISPAAAEDKDEETESARRKLGSLILEEEKSTSSASATAQTDPKMDLSRRRRQFLILSHFEGRATSDIKGRVTLSVFVLPIPKHDENNSLWEAYQHLGATFGQPPTLLSRDESPPRYWNRRRVWFYGEEEEEDLTEGWMNWTFGGGSGVNHSGGPGPKTLVCQFRIWNDEPRAKVNRHVEREEANAKDSVFKRRWDELTDEWMSRGRILAWKLERWDFRGVPRDLPEDPAHEVEEEEEEEAQ